MEEARQRTGVLSTALRALMAVILAIGLMPLPKLAYASEVTAGNFSLLQNSSSTTYVVNQSPAVASEGTYVVKNGSAELANPSAVLAGTELTVVPAPAVGYEVDKVTCEKVPNGSPVLVENNKFTMPESDVLVGVKFKDVRTDLGSSDVNLKYFDSSYAFTGQAIQIKPKVDKTSLKEGTDFTIAFKKDGKAIAASEFKEIGTYEITITGIGAYKGSKTKTVKIVPYFTVYLKTGDADPVAVKSYNTASEFAALKSDDTSQVNALMFKDGGWQVVSANTYVTLAKLLEEAGISDKWTTGATITYDGKKAAQTFTYDQVNSAKWFYPNAKQATSDKDNAVETPFVFSLTGTTKATDKDNNAGQVAAKNASATLTTDAPRVVFGIPESSYVDNPGSDKFIEGQRLWSNVTYVTISVPESPVPSKKAQTLTFAGKAPSVSYSGQAQVIEAKDAFSLSGAQTKVTYSLTGNAQGFKIDSEKGAITVPAGLAAGKTYELSVKADAAATDEYEAATASTIVKVTVNQAANPFSGVTTNGKAASVKYNAKKATPIDGAKTFQYTLKGAPAGAAVTYSLAKAVKGFSVDSKGNVTVAKKTAANKTYTLKINVKVGGGNYAEVTKAVSVKVKVAGVAQTISGKSKGVTYKGKAISNGALKASKTFNTAKKCGVKAKTTLTYAKANKAGGKLITVNAKTGKITAKKGLKAGTYKVAVKASAAANSVYAPKTKTVYVTVTVANK